jgi:hypothetical protein
MNYERRTDKLLPWPQFRARMLGNVGLVAGICAVSLAIGRSGYTYFEHLSWRSAFLNSAMLLGGMGPVDPPQTDGGKIFAGFYALFAGLFFLVAAALILAPVFHRIMHVFHLQAEKGD